MNRRNFLSIFPVAAVGMVSNPTPERVLEDKVIKSNVIRVQHEGQSYDVLLVKHDETINNEIITKNNFGFVFHTPPIISDYKPNGFN